MACKRCLALMDQYFPAPRQHERLDLVVEVLADIVSRYGYAEIHGVPGDQQATLRKKARMEVRRRTGYSCTTFALNSSQPRRSQGSPAHAQAVIPLSGETARSPGFRHQAGQRGSLADKP
jgi:hypothetical protein